MTRESLDEDDDVPFDEFHVTEIEGAMQKLLVSLLGHCQGAGKWRNQKGTQWRQFWSSYLPFSLFDHSSITTGLNDDAVQGPDVVEP